jgi:hypothetical protein
LENFGGRSLSFVRDEDHVKILEESVKLVGPLHPALVNERTGKVLSGRHRTFARESWPEEKRDLSKWHIEGIPDADEAMKEDVIMLHANFQRQPSAEETKHRLIRIADGLVRHGVPKSEACSEIVKRKLVPYGKSWLEKLLPSEYKAPTIPKKRVGVSPTSQLTADAKEEAKDIHTALSTLSTFNGEVSLPFKNCKCQECEHKQECY